LPGQLNDAVNSISDTASIIGNFSSLLLERSAQPEPAAQAEPEDDDLQQPETIIPLRSLINGRLYVESRAMAWLELK